MNTLDSILRELEENNKKSYKYSLSDAEKLAEKILTSSGYYYEDDAVPIIKVAKSLGFEVYKSELSGDLSASILINENSSEEDGYSKKIIVNSNDELFHQRFAIAHELGHYFFNFLGKFEDQNNNFTDKYYEKKHISFSEKIANRFAASILMPKEAFIKQYNIARATDGRKEFIITYLSRFFEIPINSIEKRIIDVSSSIGENILPITNIITESQENSQSKEVIKHTEIYTDLLRLSVLSTRINIIMKTILKSLFFAITMGILIAIICLFFITLNYAFITFGKMEISEISTESILSVVTVLLPVISSLVVALLKIPQIIAKYLFNIKEDNFMDSVIKSIQGYDTSMFAMENKLEGSIMINRKPSGKSKDEDLKESPSEIFD